jgi:hypothetical protein
MISLNSPKNNASKPQRRPLRMPLLPPKKYDRQKRKKLNVSMMPITTLQNLKQEIKFVTLP